MASLVYLELKPEVCDDSSEFILYRHLPKMTRLIEMSSLRIYLRSEEFMSDDDMERLKPSPPEYVGSQVIEALAIIVHKRGEDGLQKFMAALQRSANEDKHPGHKELYEILQKDIKGGCDVTTRLPITATTEDHPTDTSLTVAEFSEGETEVNAMEVENDSTLSNDTRELPVESETGDGHSTRTKIKWGLFLTCFLILCAVFGSCLTYVGSLPCEETVLKVILWSYGFSLIGICILLPSFMFMIWMNSTIRSLVSPAERKKCPTLLFLLLWYFILCVFFIPFFIVVFVISIVFTLWLIVVDIIIGVQLSILPNIICNLAILYTATAFVCLLDLAYIVLIVVAACYGIYRVFNICYLHSE